MTMSLSFDHATASLRHSMWLSSTSNEKSALCVAGYQPMANGFMCITSTAIAPIGSMPAVCRPSCVQPVT